MTHTIMEREARSAPEKIANQLQANDLLTRKLGQRLREFAPKFVMIVGRGSSDHAGVFAKYLFEIEAGVPTFAAAPSVASVYGKRLQLAGGLVIVISQSGRSPDILAQAKMAREAGAFCVALVNDETAPIKDIVDLVLPLRAGEEQAVAATKSYLATLSALLQLAAAWTQSPELARAIDELPRALQSAVDAEPQLTAESLQHSNNLVVLGRGLGYAISKEIALKLKEVCAIHAEAFSSAEFLHGPVTLVENQLKIVDVCVADESYASHLEQIAEVGRRGAELVHLKQTVNEVHPRVAPLALLQRFYIDVAAVAIARGIDPDQPAGLKKVTQTL
ncbi:MULTISPECIES: glucosamine-6-phosphate deaminase NagB-II [Shewanella]|uniref:glucosamine-6-phosphate deaminase NagB-II n=1 Tax=Shewanella TaxID=22 RepID=UPI001182742C|nr:MULTISPECIES: SIS domain-containing protein [Shewanella]MCE9852510.1 SIS domain-containing protein [Shewanella chilikensis]TVO84824.1 glutamine--fructose-6-phosphate aminotransferase [Shewanella algae]TXS84440.1 glutamine--fructose-6-phosphate aminotransferase [Shewanella algae]